MSTIRDFLWLAGQALSVPLYFWPVTAVVGVITAMALGVGRTGLWRVPPRSWLLLGSFYLVPVAVLFYGALLRHADRFTPAPRWPSITLDLCLIVVCCAAAFVIWRAIGFRLVAFAAILGAIWLSLCALFITGMALTNDWL